MPQRRSKPSEEGGKWLRERRIYIFGSQQAALILRHPNDLSKEKSACIDQLNQANSHLVMEQGELDVIQDKHNCVTQKVAELEKALRLACEEEK